MPDQPTVQHHADHASFELPARLKDKTMHMFTLKDDGPSEFSVVMSHADTQAEEKLEDFSDRLLKELTRALPKFQLRGLKETTLDGAPAIELAYSWRNDGNFMHQRQAITIVQGARPGTTQALMIAATCLAPFSEEWNGAFDALLASVKLRRPLGAAQQAAAPPASAPSLPYVYALSERRRTLHVFGDQDEACRKTDAREVEQDAWAFFDAAGAPLQASFTVPNSGTLFRKAGAYLLAPHADPAAPGLRARLAQAAVLQTSSAAIAFTSLAEVQAHLDQVHLDQAGNNQAGAG